MNGTARDVPASRFPQLLGNWHAGDGPLARRLADAVAKAIRDGRFLSGHGFPPNACSSASSVSRGAP
ncbi:hypothetical protein ACFYW1_04450 [Streptomyces sp. NPDC002669]|uniref:hypothetical protein n=1 Tax=Streptomyces sp. NPDC002669 TaxID=3364658 RepID=UPI00367BBC9D